MSRTLAMPFHIALDGSVGVEEHPANQLTNRVTSVVATQPGSRIMRPVYGTNIGQFVFGWGGALHQVEDLVQGADAADMADVARRALAAYEPDAFLDRLRITQMPDDNGVMRVEVMYRPSKDAASANPNVVVREVVFGGVSAGTFSEFTDATRPHFWNRNAPEYDIRYEDEDGAVTDSVFDALGGSTL